MRPKSADFESAIRHGQIVEGMSFNQKALALCARVPKGKVTTYAHIARELGSPRGARAVGNAMHTNPFAPDVPCHRVVGSSGSLTGYAGGLPKKAKMLEDEGVKVCDGKRVDVKSGIFRF